MINQFILMIMGLLGATKAIGESCDHSYTRLKKGPADYTDIIAANVRYEDEDFNGRDMLYWLGYDDLRNLYTYEWGLWFGDMSFKRIHEVYPDATLFGNNNPQWHDVMQGLTGDCYIEASMAAIAEFP